MFPGRARDISTVPRLEAKRDWGWVSGTIMWSIIRTLPEMQIL